MAYPNQYLIGRDPFEEQRRLQMMYGNQPPVGIAGSVPQQIVAPMPSIPQMPPQPQPQMGIGLSQQPVVPPAPQPQPQGVSVANNTAASQPSFQQSAEELQKAREMSAFENAQMTGEAPKFNSKALGKALSGAFKSGQGLYNQEIKNIGLLREAQAPQMGVGAAMQQPQQQPGMSGAMQAISGGIGSQPQLLEMLKRMRR